MEALERMPFLSQKKVFSILDEYADSHALNKEEYNQYWESLLRATDNELIMQHAIDQGLAQGKAQGMAQGKEEGRYEQAIETAHELIAMGMLDEQIAKATHLSVEDVKHLRTPRAEA